MFLKMCRGFNTYTHTARPHNSSWCTLVSLISPAGLSCGEGCVCENPRWIFPQSRSTKHQALIKRVEKYDTRGSPLPPSSPRRPGGLLLLHNCVVLQRRQLRHAVACLPYNLSSVLVLCMPVGFQCAIISNCLTVIFPVLPVCPYSVVYLSVCLSCCMLWI